ncbi:MAG: hypothetical protein ACYCPS_06215 [Candidatus Saccharimonadales bacterium]
MDELFPQIYGLVKGATGVYEAKQRRVKDKISEMRKAIVAQEKLLRKSHEDLRVAYRHAPHVQLHKDLIVQINITQKGINRMKNTIDRVQSDMRQMRNKVGIKNGSDILKRAKKDLMKANGYYEKAADDAVDTSIDYQKLKSDIEIMDDLYLDLVNSVPGEGDGGGGGNEREKGGDEIDDEEINLTLASILGPAFHLPLRMQLKTLPEPGRSAPLPSSSTSAAEKRREMAQIDSEVRADTVATVLSRLVVDEEPAINPDAVRRRNMLEALRN